MSQNINLSLTKPQAEFIQLQQECLYPLFTGGYGSGKSYTMAISAFLDALHSPDAWVAIYEPTYGLIIDIAMPYIAQLLEIHNIPYQANKDEKVIITHSKQIGNFRFRSMDDPGKLVGYEVYSSHVDEIDTLDKDKASRVWDMIMGRCRQWPKNIPKKFMCFNEKTQQYEPRNKVCAYSTPEGFNFTYSVWAKNENPQYRHLKCKTEDNPFASQSYIDNLKEKYTEEKIKAYLEGEWVNLNSGTVYYAYDLHSHASQETIKTGENLYIGCDFNVANMSAVVFVKRDGGKTWHAVDEISGVLDTPDLVDEIQSRYPGHKIICYPDSSGSSRDTTNASTTDILQLKKAGFRVKAKSKNPLVKDRVACVNNAFSKRRLLINVSRCPNLVECLTQQAYDKGGRPDKSQGHDHLNDALGYAIYYEMNMKAQCQVINFDFARRA